MIRGLRDPSIQELPVPRGSVGDLEVDCLVREDPLDGLTAAHGDAGPERGMDVEQRLECSPQRGDLHLGVEPRGHHHVVGRARRRD